MRAVVSYKELPQVCLRAELRASSAARSAKRRAVPALLSPTGKVAGAE